uniref:SIN3 transcription regulator family member B n=1 Tax=Latimeria chalumnae TaxID=7897 RepID=H2ZVE2_LATCH
MAKNPAHLQQLNHQVQAQAYMVQKEAQQQHFQKLKVEDALSYLDQVKIRFGSDPRTYNEFLDIMKEFKLQSVRSKAVVNSLISTFFKNRNIVLNYFIISPPPLHFELKKNGACALKAEPEEKVSPGAIKEFILGISQTEAPSSEADQNEQIEGFPQQLGSKEERERTRTSSSSSPTQDLHPIEFDSAISYVNKIKNRFLDNPEIYRSFLEILHTYQKEQLSVKELKGRVASGMTEEEVFVKVASLFKEQEDLLSEFGQFLPDAKRSLFTGTTPSDKDNVIKSEDGNENPRPSKKRMRPMLMPQIPPPVKKKLKLQGLKDRSVASMGKHGTLHEFTFFDKVRRVLKSQDVYENFLRCIALFNQEVVSGSELLQLVTPFLGKFPELFAQFKSFLGEKELSHGPPLLSERSMDGSGREIDYASCKRLGSSYRALPKAYQQPKCSGRTTICKEVLNDTWVSFPSWSEDSTFVSSKKTPYEEQLHRCEDERFELDVVLETNLATIRVLESVQKKLSRLSQEDQEKFKLDDCLGGTSEVIQRRAIYRIYGDKAPEIIEGLKKNPATAVPVVLKRLKAKEEEWREAQQGFNRIWREQYEKAYLKSLDHQGVNFKQNDVKALRSKSLLNEIESIYDEHQEQSSEEGKPPASGPHLIYVYEDKQILEDAASLIIYHVKRQPTIQKEDKDHIKRIIHHFIPDLFFARRGELSEPGESSEEEVETSPELPPNSSETRRRLTPGLQDALEVPPEPVELRLAEAEQQKGLDDVYSLFFVNNNWYFFLRLHQILCSRLLRIYRQAEKQLLDFQAEKEKEKLLHEGRKEKSNDPATELRLKQPSEVELEEYYPAFLAMVRSLLDGNLEPTHYEDTLREMFTIHAYIGFTIDKIIQNIIRQLQHLVSDDICLQVVELYMSEKKRGAAGGNLSSQSVRSAKETAYQWKAERVMADENCFKVMFMQSKEQVTLTIELLDTEEPQSEDPLDIQNLASYMEQYMGAEGAQDHQSDGFFFKPVFLPRNLQKFRKWQIKQMTAVKREQKSLWRRRLGVETASSVDCRFKLNTHKMVFVMNSEDYMYRRGALLRARQLQPSVSRTQHHRFEEWHSHWLETNVTDEMADIVQDWLMGEDEEDMVPCKTMCETVNVHGIPVNKYRVRYSRQPHSP